LWDIAASAMGPGATDVEVALEWPRWFEANRAVIGQNPDVLLPGQILQPPSAA
jgi:nucleoid-associated protein YgaU